MIQTVAFCALFFLPEFDDDRPRSLTANVTLLLVDEDGRQEEWQGKGLLAGQDEAATRRNPLRRRLCDDIAEALRHTSWDDREMDTLHRSLTAEVGPSLLRDFNARHPDEPLDDTDLAICLHPFLDALKFDTPQNQEG